MKETQFEKMDPSEDDLEKDVKNFQDFKKEQEAQQEKELSEDLKKFEERPKPAWYQDPGIKSIQGVNEELPGVPLDSLTRYDLYQMEREGADSHQLAEWRETLSKAEEENVRNSSVAGGDGVGVFDVIGNKTLFYPHRKNSPSEATSSQE
jgi:hypothetical protein